MADKLVTDKHSEQKSKIIFVDRRTLFMRGHEEIGADILQKAFDNASGSSDDHLALNGKSCYDTTEVSDIVDSREKNGNDEPFLAIYEGDNGETTTVRLTAEEAESMGIHFSSDSGNQDVSELSFAEQLHIEQLPDGMTEIYSEEPENDDQRLFEDHDINETMIFEDSEIIHTTQENEEHLISSMSGFLSENGNQQLTLSIPQLINGKVTYTVKVSDELQPPGETLSKFNVPLTINERKHNALQLAPQSVATKRTSLTLPSSIPNATSSVSKAQPSMTDQCSRTITVKQSLMHNKKQKYLVESRPKQLTNAVTPKAGALPVLAALPLYDSAVVKIQPEAASYIVLPPRPKTAAILATRAAPPDLTISAKSEIAAVPKLKPAINITAGKFTHVMASEGQLVSGSATDQGKQMSSELSAVLTKMMPRQINKTKPLGSSENPIQLVQHGQTFHSVQSLNQEQLKQIATVLQRQHLETPPRAAKNVLYNAETNTRIIYRVVYPEDLKDSAAAGKGKRGRPRKIEPVKLDGKPKEEAEEVAEDQKAKRPRGRPRKCDMTVKSPAYAHLEEPQPKEDLDETGEEAQERKRLVARTRSGRVSRPPRHMVKDYKRLHRLDLDEPDLDDSDGGYSDYQTAEPDEELPPLAEPSEEPLADKDATLLTGLPTVKRNISSNNRCPTCLKIYLGQTRMSHHFELNPDHRVAAPKGADATDVNGHEKAVQLPASGKKKKKGPWAYLTAEARSERRKLKLRELLATLEPGELAEVAGPALADALSLWDLALLRVRASRAQHSYAAALCAELAAMLERTRAVATQVLRPVTAGGERLGDEIQLEDAAVCAALGLPRGLYRVEDGPLRPSSPTSQSTQPVQDLDDPPCPELLTALTLVAKKPEPKPVPEKELLLPADLCSLPQRNSPDLQNVYDIVHEGFKNLPEDSLRDFISSPMTINGRSPEIETESSSLINTLEHFQSNESKSVWEKEKEMVGSGQFDESDLRMDDSGNEHNASEVTYDADMALEEMSSDRIPSGEFDSEMELAGIGDEEREGDSANMSGVSFDPSDSLMEDDEVEFASNVNSSNGSYDREMSLTEVQESGSSKPSDGEASSPVGSRTFPGLGLVDVSLDESGPELDFEAMSEEFNRNTRHNS